MLPLLGGQHRLRVGERGEVRFELADTDQRIVPPDFELAGDQAVVRVDRVVLALRTLRLIARFLQGPAPRPGAARRPCGPTDRARPARPRCPAAGSPRAPGRSRPVRWSRLRARDRSSDPVRSDSRHRHSAAPGRPGRCRRRTTCARIVHSAIGRPTARGLVWRRPASCLPVWPRSPPGYVDSRDTRPTKCTPHGCRGSGRSTPPEASAGGSRPFSHAGPRPRSWRPSCHTPAHPRRSDS